MLWPCNHNFLLVPLNDLDNERLALCFDNGACKALESSVRHSPLLSTIEDNANLVPLGIGMHDPVDENPALL